MCVNWRLVGPLAEHPSSWMRGSEDYIKYIACYAFSRYASYAIPLQI